MIGIARKDIWSFAFNFLVVPGLWAYYLGTYDALEPGIAGGVGAFLFLVIFGPVLHNEMTESRDSGYLFLSTLPLSRSRLVAGKFVLPLLVGIAYVSLAFAMFSILESTAASLALARACVLWSFAACLPAAGWYYVGIFRFGFTALFRWLPVVLALLPFLVAVGFEGAARDLARGEVGGFAPFIHPPVPYLAAGAGLLLYVALMRLAAATKEISR